MDIPESQVGDIDVRYLEAFMVEACTVKRV